MAVAALFSFKSDQIKPTDKPANLYDVRILRDSWGVPHIFGVTDADVAYGLAYAHAEDDFETIQKSMLAGRGRLAAVFGAHQLKNEFGRVDVPWKNVNRLIRGQVDIGMGGAPDMRHAVYGEKMASGQLKGQQGDSYILLVSWDEHGHVHSRSIHQYGSATSNEKSPHYADQAPLFVQRQLKPVWMDEREIREHLEREYRPGDKVRR